MTEPQDPFATQPPAAPQPYGAPPPAPYGAPLYGEPLPHGAPGQRRNGLGTAAMVLGIVAIIPCFWLVLIPAVLAVVFGLIGRSRASKQQATNGGMALTGVVLGSLALIPGVAFWALVFSNTAALDRYQTCRADAVTQSQSDECTRTWVHDTFGVDLGRPTG